jgi:hypothetical protein
VKRKLSALTIAIIMLVVCATASAHHSNSMYDRDHQRELIGTITKYELINPHVQIAFDVKDSQGNVQKWIAEGPNTAQMSENGWKKDTLKPGDRVTIVGNLAKDGHPSIRLRWITLPNGKDLFAYSN